MGATPDYGALLDVIWGNYYEGANFPLVAAASGVIVGTNPPYTVTDFLAMFPNFGGKAVIATGNTDGTTGVITNINPAGITVGSPIAGNGVPDGSIVITVGTTTITINNNTTTVATAVSFITYPNLLVPYPIIVAYIYLASNSLMQARYGEMWSYVMALFIAHYCTLWLQSQALTPNANAAQVATSGLALGIKISKQAGDVSLGMKPLDDLQGWGAFQLTLYGQQFATIAKTVGSLPMFLW